MSGSALVYLAPVPSASFRQRPQAFVEYFLALGVDRVIWVEPYPTRLLRWHDFRKLRGPDGPSHTRQNVSVIDVHALPIEPLAGLRVINRVAFWHARRRLRALLEDCSNTVLVIGKPSLFARSLLQQRWTRTLYDAMDNFPYFYSGLDRLSMARVEDQIIAGVDVVIATSKAIAKRIPGAELVPNGYDPATVLSTRRAPQAGRPIIGYVGTLGRWFDWRLVLRIAAQFPEFDFDLIGPIAAPAPGSLPVNVRLLGEKPHDQAMHEAAGFSAGIIPFLINELTDGVDPVKYYEYRALGLPVIATPFGALARHVNDDELFFIHGDDQIGDVVRSAVASRRHASAASNTNIASWRDRFSDSKNIQSLVQALEIKPN